MALNVVGREVLEVLYSPVNAFKRIIEHPDFKGVLLVLVLVVSATLASQYVISSKLYLEDRFPENDDWTESITGWVSNGAVQLDSADYMLGNADGNHSIGSSVQSETSIWLKINDIGPVNCSGEHGYIELFFWIKWTSDVGSPSSGTLTLFSGREGSYFQSDITGMLAPSGEWTNITLSVGSVQGWTSNNSPSWQNITGIEINLEWASSANQAMKIDGLFFRRYSSPIETGEFGQIFPSILIQLVLNFAMNWILWAGILMLVAKLFNEDLGHWNIFFVVIGYSFMAAVIYNLVSVLPLTALPSLNVPMDTNALTALLETTWYPLLAYQLWIYIPIIGEVWIAALGAIAIHVMKDITWSKAATIAAVAFAIRFILRLFLGF